MIQPEAPQVADYKVVQQIGRGRFYLAVPPSRLGLTTPHVALKVIVRNFSDDDFQRLLKALSALAAVQSPQVADLYEVGRQEASLFYSMEYARRGSLAAPSEPLQPAAIIAAVADAARGAHAMHEAGVPHREMKPANILLTDQGAKLSDVGMAQIMSPGMTASGLGDSQDIEYLDPSIIRGEPASRASDIWALGVTLHATISGSSIYGALPTDVPNALLHVLRTAPVVDPGIAQPVADAIRRCLAADPALRYPTAAELAADLDRAGGILT